MTPLQDLRLKLIEQRGRNCDLQEENQNLRIQISKEREIHLAYCVQLHTQMNSITTSMAFRGLLEEPVLAPLPKRKPALWRRVVRGIVDAIRGES